MSEFDRTVLVVGDRRRYIEYIRDCLPEELRDVRIPISARAIVIGRVRHVQVVNVPETREYHRDETTYTYVGPYHTQFDNVMLACLYAGYLNEPLKK